MPELDLNAVVTQRIEITPWLIILRVSPDGWALPEFRPGQFAVLGLPGSAPRHPLSDPEEDAPAADKLIRRAYSIASSSLAREYMDFYLNLVGSGSLTPRLFALGMGDHLWLGPKIAGMFTMDQVPDEANIVMIATGTGLAPYMSMLTTHLTCGPQQRHIAVLHGARHSWELGYRAELENLMHLCSNFAYVPIISRPSDEPVRWTGFGGHVQDLWRRGVIAEAWGFEPSPTDTHIFLCGSPAMIDQTEEMLCAEGYREHTRKKPGQIHVERYW